jgi:hypothetical protein
MANVADQRQRGTSFFVGSVQHLKSLEQAANARTTFYDR